MRLNELSTIHYHDELNPAIWDGATLKNRSTLQVDAYC